MRNNCDKRRLMAFACLVFFFVWWNARHHILTHFHALPHIIEDGAPNVLFCTHSSRFRVKGYIEPTPKDHGLYMFFTVYAWESIQTRKAKPSDKGWCVEQFGAATRKPRHAALQGLGKGAPGPQRKEHYRKMYFFCINI